MTYKTRADLRFHPAFSHLDTDSDGQPCVWENHFTCRTCSSEQIDWTDTWSCQCDNDCPNCGDEYEPYDSVWIGPNSAKLRQLWEDLPEAGMSPPAPAQSVSEPVMGESRDEPMLFAGLSNLMAQQREEERKSRRSSDLIISLLREAHTMIKDGLVNNYPIKELHTSPEDLLERIAFTIEVDE